MYIYIHICVCIYLYTYLYTRMYIYTYTHSKIHMQHAVRDNLMYAKVQGLRVLFWRGGNLRSDVPTVL